MNFNQELDTMWGKDNRIDQIEEELAKVTARYNYVRDMTPEDFGDLSTINEDFDSQVDELIKDRIAKYPITRGDDLSIESAREIARTALASQEPTLKNNEFIPDSTEGRIQAAIKCLNMHWVSHDANRFDYAIEGLEKCLAGLASQAQQEPNKDVHEAIILLSAVFDAWENGTDCYDDFDGVSGSFIGKAFNLDDEIFNRCCDLLNRVNPPRNVSQAQQTESQWNPIETAPKNKKIIVRYKNALGKDRTVFAKYLDKFTEEASEGTDCETDYCEDDDTFYCKEGWVELIDNWDDFSSVYFDSRNVTTHWMVIPPAPEGDKE